MGGKSRTRWQDIPAPPVPKLVQEEPEDETGAEEDKQSREAG
jgi:hypothetical protein